MKKMREMGNKFFYVVWDFVCDLIELIVGIYHVALSPKKAKYNLKARTASSVIAAGATCGVIAKLVHGSFIWSGIQYGIASIEKHLAIFWATDGDWAHWMSGGRYNFFKAFKDNLISTDGFAKFLNDLAGNGIALKIVQLVLIAACFAAMIGLVYVVAKCIDSFCWSIKTMYARKKAKEARRNRVNNSNVYDIRDYQSRKQA